MSPGEASRAIRARLAAQIKDEVAALRALADAIASLRTPTAEDRTEWMRSLALAFEIERFYTGIEALLVRILRTLDGDVPVGPDSHAEILRAAGVAIEGGRPALVPPEALASLRELLAFRHLARHAYAVEPELRRMDDHAARAAECQAVVETSMARLGSWLMAP